MAHEMHNHSITNRKVEFKMIVCPRCGLQHLVKKEFCETCGAFLLMEDEAPGPNEGKEELPLICPRCQDYRPKGNYCKKCGSLLMRGTPSRESRLISFEKKWVRKRSKEWQRLVNEKKTIENCLKSLETQKEKVSGDVCQLMVNHYQERLKELSCLHQDLEKELGSVQKRVLEEIEILENELKPIQKRLEEFRLLHQEAGITKSDFLKEKRDLQNKIQWRSKRLDMSRELLSLLPQPMAGPHPPKGFRVFFSRPIPFLIAGGLLFFTLLGGYALHQSIFPSEPILSEGSPTATPTLSSSEKPKPAPKDKDVEPIHSLFEKVRQANLQQNIDLFMTCFSQDFVDKEKKKSEALKTWNHFQYHTLSFDIKKQSIAGDTADIQLEWFVKSSEKRSGKLEENRILLSAILKKENGSWKIFEIRPAN